MNLGEWKDVILLTLGFLLSIGAGIIGAYVQRRLDRRGERRPLNQLLNFGPDQLLFVFPHREEIAEAILPRTSTEDFLAMNNVISALINIGWARKIGVRDTSRVTEADKKRNLVIICSPKSNNLATTFQEALEKSGREALSFQKGNLKRWHICDSDGAAYQSKSFAQEEEYRSCGVTHQDLPTQSYEDFAVITKTANPWNDATKVLWVAGIRGIGTWGAAECIKKEWKQIHDQLPHKAKDCDFSALLRIEYDNCDITTIDVRRVLPLAKR